LIDSYSDDELEINSISQQMSGSVDRIVEETLRSLNYFKKKFPEIEEPDKLFISGQGADLHNMGLLLRRITKKSVERINPLLGIGTDSESIPAKVFNRIASAHSVAIGLARNLIGSPNLAPAESKEKISFDIVIKLFSIAALLLVVILTSITLSVKNELNEKNKMAQEAEAQLASLSPIQQQFLFSSKEIAALKDFVSIMITEENRSIWLRSQLRLLSALSPPEMMLSHVDLRTGVTQTDQDKGVSFVQLTGAIFADDFFFTPNNQRLSRCLTQH